jgi:hypothetical protein
MRGARADNGIEAEGAVALAAALQGNTTLQTLDLSCMLIARCVCVRGKGGPLRGPLARAAGRRELLVVVVGRGAVFGMLECADLVACCGIGRQGQE